MFYVFDFIFTYLLIFTRSCLFWLVIYLCNFVYLFSANFKLIRRMYKGLLYVIATIFVLTGLTRADLLSVKGLGTPRDKAAAAGFIHDDGQPCDRPKCHADSCKGAGTPKQCPYNLTFCRTGCVAVTYCDTRITTYFELKHCMDKKYFSPRKMKTTTQYRRKRAVSKRTIDKKIYKLKVKLLKTEPVV